MDLHEIQLGLIWYVIFLFSLVLHEASHALVSLKLGDPTAHEGGQVSLNPIPHIQRELFGTTIVPILSYFLAGWMFGWASIPQDGFWARNNPKKSATVAIAGPAANLLLVIISFITIRIFFYLDIFYAPDTINFSSITAAYQTGMFQSLATVLSITFSLNLILFLFNLFPLPSFDGIHVLFFFVEDKHVDKLMEFAHNPALSLFGLLIAWNIFDYIYHPIHLIFINFLYPGISYS